MEAPVGWVPAAPRIAPVWLPMSDGPDSYQARKCPAIRVRASSLRRSAPVAATSRMAQAIVVSSVHSPGAKFPSPPPIMRGPSGPTGATANS